VVGSEFWLFASDTFAPLMHFQRIANRGQLLTFDAGCGASIITDARTTPVLAELQQVDDIDLFGCTNSYRTNFFRAMLISFPRASTRSGRHCRPACAS
jgi:hypothetical protein